MQEEGEGFPPTISCAGLATMSGEQTKATESTVTKEFTGDLPKSSGVPIGNPSVLLPAVALLLGSVGLVWAVLRRRWRLRNIIRQQAGVYSPNSIYTLMSLHFREDFFYFRI